MSETSEPVDVAALRAVAQAATPGPWEARTGGTHAWVALYDDENKIPEGESLPSFESGGTATHADAAHIAAWSPVQATAALDEITHLRAEVERLRGEVERVREDALKDHVTTHARHVVRLSAEMERSEAAEAARDEAEAALARVKALVDYWQADADGVDTARPGTDGMVNLTHRGALLDCIDDLGAALEGSPTSHTHNTTQETR